MSIYLYSHNRFVIKHWQEALKHNTPSLHTRFEYLLKDLSQISHDKPKHKDVVLYDFSHHQQQMEKHLQQLSALALCLVLDCQADFKRGKSALNAGARGYGNAMMYTVHLHSAIATIKEGKIWLYPDFISELIMQMNLQQHPPIEQNPRLEPLSEREKEVAILVKQGLNNKEIAEKLQITVRTVKAHTGKIYQKLGVKDRLGLVLILQ